MDQRVLFLLLCGRRRVILSTFTCWKKRSLIVLRSNQRPAANERPFFGQTNRPMTWKHWFSVPNIKKMMLASLENIMWNCHISKKVMTIWSRVIVTFLQKKNQILPTLIEWLKIDIYSCFLMKNPRNFHLLYVIALFGAQKKMFRQSQ